VAGLRRNQWPASGGIRTTLRYDKRVSDAPGREFLEQAIDLLRTQLVRDSGFRVLTASGPRRGLANWQVRRVTCYMRERLDQEICLNELAALVALSRFHFCTAFRLATGRTTREWLTHERMTRA
jgi:AraC family transcriptional regulator